MSAKATAMFSFLKPPPAAALGILGFHNLTPTCADPATPPHFPRSFERLARILARRYECVTISDGVRRLRNGETPRRPLLAIIFDDGYRDAHAVAAPILRRAGIPATCYVVVDCLATGHLPWYEELGRVVYRTPRREFTIAFNGRALSWPLAADAPSRKATYWDIVGQLKAEFHRGVQSAMSTAAAAHDVPLYDAARERIMMNATEAQALVAAGFEIGCHSITHPILPALTDSELATEIGAGRTCLESLLGSPVTSFCFPNGDNDSRCLDVAEHSGYSCAVSMTCGANTPPSWRPFQLRRIPMSERIDFLWPWHTAWRVRSTLASEA